MNGHGRVPFSIGSSVARTLTIEGFLVSGLWETDSVTDTRTRADEERTGGMRDERKSRLYQPPVMRQQVTGESKKWQCANVYCWQEL